MECYIIRHGRTEFNDEDRIMGQRDSPLTPEGMKQIKQVAHQLKDITFDVIYSSDLQRAVTTAKVIREQLLQTPPLQLKKVLREIDYGIFTGQTKEDVRQNYPQYHVDVQYTNPEGESFAQLYQRVITFVQRLDHKRVLLVTHAGCIRAIYSYCREEDFQQNLNMNVTNTVIMRCKIDDRKDVEILQP